MHLRARRIHVHVIVDLIEPTLPNLGLMNEFVAVGGPESRPQFYDIVILMKSARDYEPPLINVEAYTTNR